VAHAFHPDAALGKGVAILVRKDRLLTFKEVVAVRFTDEDQGARSVGIVSIYESSTGAANDVNSNMNVNVKYGPARVFFIMCSVNLSNYGNEDKQLEQATILVQSIEKVRMGLRGQNRDCTMHLVIGGNFNMVPGSRVYNYMLSATDHRLGLTSAYGHFLNGREPAYTTVSSAWEGTTSYLFYTALELGITNLLDFPARELIGKSLPSVEFSSNNFSLQTVFSVYK